MQYLVTVPDALSSRLQQMADDEHVTVAEMLVRIAERTVFATAPNVPPANGSNGENVKLRRSLLDLEGVGAELWKGIDAQEYVNELRREWDAE